MRKACVVSRAPQHRPRHAVGDRICGAQNAHAAGSVDPDAVLGQQLLVFIDLGQEVFAKLQAILFQSVVKIVLQSSDAESVRGEPGSAVFFKDLENFLALPEGVENRRHGAQVERMRSQPQQVAGKPLQFAQYTRMVLASNFSTAST